MSYIEQAIRDLLGFLRASDIQVSRQELDASWMETGCGAMAARRRRRVRRITIVATAAAVMAGVFLATGFLNRSEPMSNIELYALKEKPLGNTDASQSIRLVMAEGSVMNVGGADARLDYSNQGIIVVDADTVAEKADDTRPRYNQLIVPYGKRSQLSLSDGTHIWVNSGSRVVYPVSFGTGDREIYLEGEAYLDVARDTSRPFRVITSQFGVKVLGTSFNVFAYPEAKAHSVVLVKGAVEVNSDDTRREMHPGQMVSASEGGKLSRPVNVDVEPYISWTRNTLAYDYECLTAVFERLHLLYGVDFEVSSEVDSMYITGKLDLQESLDDVLASLSFSVPVECRRSGNSICVSRKL